MPIAPSNIGTEIKWFILSWLLRNLHEVKGGYIENLEFDIV